MSLEWQNPLVLKFIDSFKKEPCLWDPNNPLYKNRIAHEDAWNKISEDINKPVPEIKKKRESLMSMFRRCLKVVKDNQENGVVYKPAWFAFEPLLTFLYPIYNCKDLIDYLGVDVSAKVYYESISLSSDTILPSCSPPAPPLKQTLKIEVNPPPKQTIQVIRTEIPDLRPEESTESEEPNKKKKKQTINLLIQKNEEDECDLFGKLLAKKLRRIPEEDREQVMFMINSVFMKYHSSATVPKLHINRIQPVNKQGTFTTDAGNVIDIDIINQAWSAAEDEQTLIEHSYSNKDS